MILRLSEPNTEVYIVHLWFFLSMRKSIWSIWDSQCQYFHILISRSACSIQRIPLMYGMMSVNHRLQQIYRKYTYAYWQLYLLVYYKNYLYHKASLRPGDFVALLYIQWASPCSNIFLYLSFWGCCEYNLMKRKWSVMDQNCVLDQDFCKPGLISNHSHLCTDDHKSVF